MKKSMLLLIGLLTIIAGFWILRDNYSVALEYLEFDEQQDEVINTYVGNPHLVHQTGTEAENFIPDLNIDFDSLLEVNPDIIGWLYIPGTGTNYPILLGDDDSEYLHTNYRHEYQYLGSIFAHYRTSPKLDDPYTVLFGHNMRSGRMFGNLSDYQSKSFWDANPFVYIYTPDRSLQCTIYASGYVDATDTEIFSYGYEYQTEGFRKLINTTASHSSYDCAIAPTDSDQIFCLSTCMDGGQKDKRYVVHCVVTYIEER